MQTPATVFLPNKKTTTKAWFYGLMVRAFALEAGRLGSILCRVKPKTLKLVSAVTLDKRSAIKCSAEDEMNRE